MQVLQAEHETLVKDKLSLESNLAKHEGRSHAAIERLELQQQQASLDFERKYSSLNVEGRKVSLTWSGTHFTKGIGTHDLNLTKI